MKQQTFILAFETEDGFMEDFYRFSYKKLDTCVNAIKKAAAKYSYFGTSWKNANVAKMVCYPTPDGYNKADPVAVYDLSEII